MEITLKWQKAFCFLARLPQIQAFNVYGLEVRRRWNNWRVHLQVRRGGHANLSCWACLIWIQLHNNKPLGKRGTLLRESKVYRNIRHNNKPIGDVQQRISRVLVVERSERKSFFRFMTFLRNSCYWASWSEYLARFVEDRPVGQHATNALASDARVQYK